MESKDEFVLHCAAFDGDVAALKATIAASADIINRKDRHGNTPLLLATMKGHVDCVKLLLEHGANPSQEGATIWPPLAEAVSYGSRDLVTAILDGTDKYHAKNFQEKATSFFNALSGIHDNYLEMHWKLHCWVPLVGRLLPSDTLKIWKRGHRLRADTTLLNVSERSLKRGQRSYIFTANAKQATVSMTTIDYKSGTFSKEVLFDPSAKRGPDSDLDEQVDAFMGSELTDVDMSTSTMEFARAQSGWFGFKSDRTDDVEGCKCRVYNVQDLHMLTQSRREHLSEADLKWNRQHMKDLQAGRIPPDFRYPRRESLPPPRTPTMSFDTYQDLRPTPHLGRTMDLVSKTRSVKGTVWMCDEADFPLTVRSLVNVFTVLAPTGEHVEKVKRFVDCKLPEGFPKQLDVPVFPTISARVVVQKCTLEPFEDSVFDVPQGMKEIDVESMERMHCEEDASDGDTVFLPVDDEDESCEEHARDGKKDSDDDADDDDAAFEDAVDEQTSSV
eukprot:m.276856 g.276856  ORF g.276856 m.276856 type:complete len:501 (-) comp19771_c0_seq2:746-2248(-)